MKDSSQAIAVQPDPTRIHQRDNKGRMNDALQYHSEGFMVWPTALDTRLRIQAIEAIERIQKDCHDVAEDLSALLLFEKELSGKARDGVPASEVGDALFLINDAPRFDPVFSEIVQLDILRQIAHSTLGGDAFELHFMNVTIKSAHFGRAIAWHRDYPNGYICTQQSDFIRIMLCLDGMDSENGATVFARGSHRISDEEALVQKQQLDRSGIQHLVPAFCAAGSMVLIHPKVLHGGGINQSPKPRRNIVIQLGRAGRDFTALSTESMTGTLLSLR